ncbi:MAG: YybS family protein [Desulfobacterales bacterium]|nr:YybS family protein [Desulfobacterales bacterium]
MPSQVQGKTAKDITQGIAITCVIVALSVYLPFFSVICALFIPLPVLFFRIKLGRMSAAIIPAVVICLLTILLGGLTVDVLYFSELILLGFIMGELFEKRLSVEKTVLYACTSLLVITGAGLILFSDKSNMEIIPFISDFFDKKIDLLLTIYQRQENAEEIIHIIMTYRDVVVQVMTGITPGMMTVATLFITWTTLLLAKPLLMNRGLSYPDFGPLNHWKAPEYLVWGVIAFGLMMFLSNMTTVLFASNGLLILSTVYFFGGIAIVSFYFEKKKFPRMLRVFLYSLIAIQQIAVLLVIGLGFFDMWLNFRKLENKSK